MNAKDIRWKQRFENYTKALAELNENLLLPQPSKLERSGIIQNFEVAFELSWKLMKDYLESQGILAPAPRDTIKQAFQIGLIADGHLWLEALAQRNTTTHTYDETSAQKAYANIKDTFIGLLNALHVQLLEKLS